MNAETARALADYFAGLMENESATTLKVLGAVTESGREYRPDAKSRTAWELASHIAASDVWFLDSIIQGSFAFDPAAEKKVTDTFRTVEDVVAFYRREFPDRLKQLRALPVESLTQAVDFFGMMTQPNVTYLGLANNHGIHHRGQLAAYLRAMGSKVPAMYGGSADEPFQA
ncbi:MAG TPA: DinB family protein [Vicinamibacterales bacterium]|nr:DinB family protein [Vicinamibacterales bacterium]